MLKWTDTLKNGDTLNILKEVSPEFNNFTKEYYYYEIKGRTCYVIDISDELVFINLTPKPVPQELFVEYWKYYFYNKVKDKYNTLPNNVIEKFVNNIEKDKYNYNSLISLDDLFVWSNTREGYNYWNRIDLFLTDIHLLLDIEIEPIHSIEVWKNIALEQLNAGNHINLNLYYTACKFPLEEEGGFNFSKSLLGVDYWFKIQENSSNNIIEYPASSTISQWDNAIKPGIEYNCIKLKTNKKQLKNINHIKSIF